MLKLHILLSITGNVSALYFSRIYSLTYLMPIWVEGVEDPTRKKKNTTLGIFC